MLVGAWRGVVEGEERRAFFLLDLMMGDEGGLRWREGVLTLASSGAWPGLSGWDGGHWRAGRDTSTWEGWLNSQLVWAASEPWTFLFYTLLLLSPCLLASAGPGISVAEEWHCCSAKQNTSGFLRICWKRESCPSVFFQCL